MAMARISNEPPAGGWADTRRRGGIAREGGAFPTPAGGAAYQRIARTGEKAEKTRDSDLEAGGRAGRSLPALND
jgi:hypothetical protein